MSIADQVYHYTARKIAHLQSIQDSGSGRGMLAELRRGVGKAPGELPELWGMLFDRIPEELTGKNGASPAEWAVYEYHKNEENRQQREFPYRQPACSRTKHRVE